MVTKYQIIMKRVFYLLTLITLLCSCSEIFVDKKISKPNETNLPDITASFAEGATRTYVENNKYLRWNADDRLTIFYGNSLNRQYKFNGKTGDHSGTFSLVPSGVIETGNLFDNIYAVYPYNENVTIDDISKQITLTLPAEQIYSENSFGIGANTMFALTENLEDTFLAFRNVAGYLKLKLYGDAIIKSIKIVGHNNEKLAGTAIVDMEYGGTPQLTMSDNATDAITLNCEPGVVLSKDAETTTEFWFVVPPVEFSNGFSISITTIDDKEFKHYTHNPVIITRNEVQPMSVLEVNIETSEPSTDSKNNIISYTATAKVDPRNKNVFGATYLTNEWDSETGKGVITFDGDVTTIGNDAFSSLTNLKSITIPNSVTTIGSKAFYFCEGLEEITFGNGVETVGYDAFYGRYSTDLIINITDIAAWCKINFGNLQANPLYYSDMLYLNGELITNLVIPEGTTTIGKYAFYGNGNIVSVTIADSVKSIQSRAFDTCYNVRDLIIGNGVETIGDYAFYNCGNIKSLTIPDSVTAIGESAFKYCPKLTNVTIGKNVTTIGYKAFSSCSGLTSITIPDGVTTICGSAFSYCSGLANITIPKSVNAIHSGAFEACYALKNIYITDLSAWCEISFGSSDSSPIRNNSTLFLNNEVLKDIIIPEGTTKIGDYAFYLYKSLVSVTIPDSVTTIGKYAFRSCSSLTSVTIGNSVTTIGERAFYDCVSLTSVTIPNSVTTIGEYAFYNCRSLTSVTIPDSVTTIGDLAFYNCRSITSVTIPDSVTTIGNSAFEGCSSLTSVTIGDSVTTIGDRAFNNCSNLTSVYCKAITPPVGRDNMFANNASNRKIYVPMESVENYKTATYWSDYADVIEGYNFD